MKRYQHLTEEIKANGWACKLQTVEVGAQGINNYILQTFINHLNVKTNSAVSFVATYQNNQKLFETPKNCLLNVKTKLEKKKACMKIAEISLRASYTIYLSRNTTMMIGS